MISYYLFRLFEALFMRLPRSVRKACFLKTADLLYLLDRKHRGVLRANLDTAFGGTLEKAAAEAVGRYAYRNLAIALLQIMENRTQSIARFKSGVSFVNTHYVDEARKSGRPVIFITGHYGNWEVAGAAIASQIMPLTTVYKALNNPRFNRYLLEARERFNMQMVEKRGAVKHLSKALKKGDAISMLFDQNTNKRDGIVIDFFGKSARQTPAPAQLARKYNAVIIPVLTHTEDFEHYTVSFYKPIEVEHSGDAEKDVKEATQTMADWLEGEIRKDPKYWFWMHRRWKTEHPELYKA